jgi:ATP-binding cassette subfamily B (MDR/TAP) protein 1
VGASGCGKSTAVGLLERFYDPLIGDIVVDGVALSAYNLTDYRKNISVVSQEPTSPLFIIANGSLYQGTVKFNILLGATRDEVTQEEIDKACQEANVKLRYNTDARFTTSFNRYRKDTKPWSAPKVLSYRVVKNNESP